MQSKFKTNHQDQLLLLPPHIENFIPEGHLSRVISEIVETFDTGKIEDQYSYQGQKSYHPKLLIKLWIYGYATGTLSGRQIAMKCETDTAYMYLASLYRPDFRTINDFRKDNISRFEEYFVAVVKLCRQMGMGNVGTISADGTKIRANASVKRVKDKESYQKWLVHVEDQISSLTKQADEINASEDHAHSDQRGDELPQEIRKKKDLKQKIQQAISELDQQKVEKLNLTDKDCRMIKSAGQIYPNYNCQGAVTTDGIIVGGLVSNNASDKKQLVPLIEQVEAITQDQVQNILADGGYSSYQNYEWLEQKGKAAYIPDQEYARRKDLAVEPYHKSNFVYQEQTDLYICPQNKELKFQRTFNRKSNNKKGRIYIGTECADCSVKSQCSSAKARHIYHDVREHLIDKARKLLDSAKGKLLYKKRMYTIEPIWGNLKFNKKITMFHLRGLRKVNGEWMLMALASNIEKIVKNRRITKLAV